jgi:hypothetical protein
LNALTPSSGYRSQRPVVYFFRLPDPAQHLRRIQYSRTPLIWIKWDTEPSGYGGGKKKLIGNIGSLKWKKKFNKRLF